MFFKVLQATNRLTNGLVVGQHTTQPALIYKWHTNAGCLLVHNFRGCSFGTHKQDFIAFTCECLNLAQRIVEGRQGLLEVDDVNFVSSAKQVRRHLGVPESGLMAKMHASSQHISHRYTHSLLRVVCLGILPITQPLRGGTRGDATEYAVFVLTDSKVKLNFSSNQPRLMAQPAIVIIKDNRPCRAAGRFIP